MIARLKVEFGRDGQILRHDLERWVRLGFVTAIWRRGRAKNRSRDVTTRLYATSDVRRIVSRHLNGSLPDDCEAVLFPKAVDVGPVIFGRWAAGERGFAIATRLNQLGTTTLKGARWCRTVVETIAESGGDGPVWGATAIPTGSDALAALRREAYPVS